MSGDVQPRKRKDKKRKKDDLGVDEPRGTAAALGEGDVFMHSQHEHGTGGHWCAKIIFFSLLFVLVGLIGLIILENRGLSELEANSVQSQYSGVLEGWLEDAPDDDHHDEHTLELKHHDDHDDDHDEAEHSEEADDDDEEHDEDEEHNDDEEDDDDEEHNDDEEDDDDEEHNDDEEDDDDEEQNDDEENDNESQEDGDDDYDADGTQKDEEQDENDSQEQGLENNEEDEDLPYRKYYQYNAAEPDDDEDGDINQDDDDLKNDDDEDDDQDDISNEVEQKDDENDDEEENNQSIDHDDDHENDNDDEGDSNEQNDEDEEEHEEEEVDTSLEVENIEKEAPEDEEPIDVELPALPEPDDDHDDDDKDQGSVEDADGDDDADDGDNADNDGDDDDDANELDDDFLEADDDEPPVERITAPSGKPFDEVEDEPSSEKPTDTLEEEEEYEKRQEQLRKEEAEASHMWLKLSIGGALLVATHAIVRRATASSDVPHSEDSREATPAIDRRMTLIPEEPTEPVPIRKGSQESYRPVIQEISKQIPYITRKSPTFEESEEEEEEEPVASKVLHSAQSIKGQEKKELYSDEEEADEEPIVHKKAAPAAAKPPPKEPTPEPEEPEEDVPDDVEIIDDEQIEEEEVEDEEEISDVDDEELLTRLEAKYGRLPEPERPGRRKDGGNSIEDAWPGEPADAYWRQQLDDAEREFNQGALMAAAERASAAQLKNSARARWIVAKSLDAAAEKKRDNALLGRAIAAYLELLKMNERLSDKKLIEIAERTINRIQFRGTYLSAEPVYRLLIRRFPNEPSHRNNLTVTFLMANRGDLAEEVLKDTLKRWPNDRLAQAQYGFILKTEHNRLEEALDLLQRALEGDTGPATEPRFYYHLGDTLLLLGRFEEAHEVHKRAAAHGHFLSAAQRSLYNVPKLKGRPWWNIEETPYIKLARDLEKHWKEILKEGEAARALYEQEKEGLKERGEWSQLDLFVRGREIDGRCARAPVTCAVVRREVAAAGCRRGQVKFSSMRAGTHVRPHVGPTNCRLRMHLGLSNTKDTFIRVHQETRQWETGKVLMFDDSFEHEVWHNGTGARLVLIVDVWHPHLSADQRARLPAI